jgi:conjugal transfer ATP-binding protein TraC
VAKKYTHEQAADLLMVAAYDEHSKLFYLTSHTMGFGFLCDPVAGGDERMQERLNVLMNMDWPANTLMQVILGSTENIRQTVDISSDLRRNRGTPLTLAASLAEDQFLYHATREPLDRNTGLRVRDIKLIITVVAPIPEGTPDPREMEKIATLQMAMEQQLRTGGFGVTTMDGQAYVQVCSEIINRGPHASWRQRYAVETDDDKPLNVQVFDYDTDLEVEASGLRLGDTYARTLSVKTYPRHVYFGQAIAYLGDLQRGTRGIRDQFIVSATVHFPDPLKQKAALNTKSTWITNQAQSSIAKFIPILGHKKTDMDSLQEALTAGDRPVRLYTGLTIFSQSREELTQSVSNTISYWGELGFTLMQDRFFTLPFFLHGLPFGADPSAMSDMFRYRTMATRQAIPFLPVFGDWKGTPTPVMKFVSRNGQLTTLDLNDSNKNMNGLIVATSGAGKSVLTNYMLQSYLSVGGRAWVIDVGYSYKNSCENLDGRYIQFDEGSSICLNPFPIVNNYKEEEDMLVRLITSMAAPRDSLTDYQISQLKRVLSQIWEQHGKDTTVDLIAQACLKQEDERIRDIGHQLHPFTTKGQYGSYFAGKDTSSFDNDFVVLELEELKGRAHLQQVVLLLLIYKIQQDIYLDKQRGERPKIVVVDEAWSLLASDGEVASFLETAWRRFRKYGASAFAVTQGFAELYRTASTRAIADNSAFLFMLEQNPQALEAAAKNDHLPLSKEALPLLKSVHTDKGNYSEIFFSTPFGAGIGRLYLNPYAQLMYSTDGKDVHAIKTRREAGMTLSEAINDILKERGRHEHRRSA